MNTTTKTVKSEALNDFKSLMAQVAELPAEQVTKVALFTQGIIAATAAGGTKNDNAEG